MELKDGLKIQILRATRNGIKRTICIYIKTNGIEYGIIKDTQDKNFYLIHLESGLSISEIEINDISEKELIKHFKNVSKQFDKTKLDNAVKQKLNDLQQVKGFCYPLN